MQLEIAREELMKMREIKNKFESKCKDYVNEIEKSQFNLNEKSEVIEHLKQQIHPFHSTNVSINNIQFQQEHYQEKNYNIRRASENNFNHAIQRFQSSSCSNFLNEPSNIPKAFFHQLSKTRTIVVPRRIEILSRDISSNFKNLSVASLSPN